MSLSSLPHFFNLNLFNAGRLSTSLGLNERRKMRTNIKLSLMFTAGILLSPASLAESQLIIGGDIVEMEVRLGYAQGVDTFTYKGNRIRFGVESDIGVSLGIEYTPTLADEAYNVVGTRFELEVQDTIGLFFTGGSEWVYFKLGYSSWQTEYTHIATGISNQARLSALEYGLGFKIPIGSHLTVYGEYLQKNANVNYPSFFLKVGNEHGDLMYDSELFAAGVYFSF